MDVDGFEKIFGRAHWPDTPFEAHAFVAEVQHNDDTDTFMLMLELLGDDMKTVSPALFSGNRGMVEAAFDAAEPERLEGQWRTFRLTPRSESNFFISVLASLADSDGVAYGIQPARQTPPLVVSNHSMPVGPPASHQDIKFFLSSAMPSERMRLAVLDVGQGAAAFLYQDQISPCAQPTLYLDIGGGCCYNAKTFPAGGVQWCFSRNPGILLSHWHWDHWAGATYGGAANTAGPLAATWLVPSTPPGPFGKRLATTVTAAGGGMMHWPAGTSPISAHKLIVGEATGTGWNDSGLALLAELRPGRFTLAPGDAAYKFLPSVLNPKKLMTLLTSHHGGDLDAKPPSNMPLPDGKGNCHAYCSVGDKNTYGHPTTLAYYVGAGWHVVQTDSRPLYSPPIHYDAETGGQVGGRILPCCSGRCCSLTLTT